MTTRWTGDTETKPAPGPLARIQALVNTIELPAGTDRLAHPDDATPWLVANGLLAAGASPTDAELDLVRKVREALRALLIHHTGGPAPQADHLAVLKALTDTSTAKVELAPDGQVQLSAAGENVGERLLELLLVMRDAQRDGTWTRLKACANDECTWAFYDRSRNHGGTWCDMSSCGNMLKNREFRARRRAGS
ncbi:RNA-binding protein [Mycolicibacterium peregrinum]|uniref:Zf-CGNR multi-domain protein n=1 Tax=Mycolicibacterium peregrinum TaxID=43304 RepID=A0A1X2AVG0_MYCPR|nr:CGNR zinc finger domain-containing protein [Mycolicibacterium peregrinum]MCV7206783.1 CGNR zinc finger domain-containing protein [Mycolicibacterium peregrinum]ORW55364.1 RNA-binding protein [Mycolicibacterium peregrinum]OWL96241.1 RNA-binding protein [Mycolicibacterium peregrinum]TGB36210.1 zf-CGNR multi-domain protein [Mycolicibacterium peregrinum]TGB38949.1 zf-CGNR multi-domain protein [Mycolicibacterium peregrinum]